MKQIPTAEEVYSDFHFNYKGDDNSILEAMRHFAKLHVEAQAKEIVEKAYVEFIDLTSGEKFDYTDVLTDEDVGADVNKESILNAYPLTNIK